MTDSLRMSSIVSLLDLATSLPSMSGNSPTMKTPPLLSADLLKALFSLSAHEAFLPDSQFLQSAAVSNNGTPAANPVEESNIDAFSHSLLSALSALERETLISNSLTNSFMEAENPSTETVHVCSDGESPSKKRRVLARVVVTPRCSSRAQESRSSGEAATQSPSDPSPSVSSFAEEKALTQHAVGQAAVQASQAIAPVQHAQAHHAQSVPAVLPKIEAEPQQPLYVVSKRGVILSSAEWSETTTKILLKGQITKIYWLGGQLKMISCGYEKNGVVGYEKNGETALQKTDILACISTKDEAISMARGIRLVCATCKEEKNADQFLIEGKLRKVRCRTCKPSGAPRGGRSVVLVPMTFQ